MRRLILIAAALTAAFAPIPKPKPNPEVNDLKAMQGKWSRTSLRIDGHDRGEKPGSVVPTIKGDVLAFASPNDAWRITLDAKKKPKHITAKNTKSAKAYFLGVYKLDGDTLTICWRQNVAEEERPTGFDAKQPKMWLCVYKRVK